MTLTWVKIIGNFTLCLMVCVFFLTLEKSIANSAITTTTLSPRLVDLLLDRDLLTPQKVAEMELLITNEDATIQEIYLNAKNEIDKVTQYNAVDRLYATAKKLTSTIVEKIVLLQNKKILSTEKETDVFIVGGGFELLYQYMHNSNHLKSHGGHVIFLPISRLGLAKYPAEFNSYLKNIFLNSLVNNRNIVLVDALLTGETLKAMNRVLGNILSDSSKNTKNGRFHVATLGIVELLGLAKPINEEIKMYRNNLAKFNNGENNLLPILKVGFSAYETGALHQLPRSHPDKFQFIDSRGTPTNVDEGSKPFLELKQTRVDPKSPIGLSRSLSVFLKRRFQSFAFFKKYYSKMNLEDWSHSACTKALH